MKNEDFQNIYIDLLDFLLRCKVIGRGIHVINKYQHRNGPKSNSRDKLLVNLSLDAALHCHKENPSKNKMPDFVTK